MILIDCEILTIAELNNILHNYVLVNLNKV